MSVVAALIAGINDTNVESTALTLHSMVSPRMALDDCERIIDFTLQPRSAGRHSCRSLAAHVVRTVCSGSDCRIAVSLLASRCGLALKTTHYTPYVGVRLATLRIIMTLMDVCGDEVVARQLTADVLFGIMRARMHFIDVWVCKLLDRMVVACASADYDGPLLEAMHRFAHQRLDNLDIAVACQIRSHIHAITDADVAEAWRRQLAYASQDAKEFETVGFEDWFPSGLAGAKRRRSVVHFASNTKAR